MKIGDLVIWPSAPNQFRENHPGHILKIHKGIATIDDWYYSSKTRQVPIKVLKKYDTSRRVVVKTEQK